MRRVTFDVEASGLAAGVTARLFSDITAPAATRSPNRYTWIASSIVNGDDDAQQPGASKEQSDEDAATAAAYNAWLEETRQALRAFYTTRNPSKINDVPSRLEALMEVTQNLPRSGARWFAVRVLLQRARGDRAAAVRQVSLSVWCGAVRRRPRVPHCKVTGTDEAAFVARRRSHIHTRTLPPTRA